MPRDITIEVDDDTYASYERSAARLGMTVPEFVLWKLDLTRPRLTMAAWLERTRGKHSNITSEEILAAIDELRGPWPEPQAEANST